ncbi:MAG: hypothetical protein ThorAB25_00290 [Candidatus Thorarchaeota archaeon AB_25]|nr:MAG: hypothetical protein ThorAB25_00290 [Candidatus Thorarchaeota archaeon AB_25]
MASKYQLRLLAGGLLIISACTHTIQVFVYGGVWHNIGAAVYGAMYLFFGIGLIRYLDKRGLVALCVILPLIGGVGGVIRFLFLHTHVANYFIILHVLIDIVVVPVSIYMYRNIGTSVATTM